MTENQSVFFHGDPQLGGILKSIRDAKSISATNLALALDVSEVQIEFYEEGVLPLSLGQLARWLTILNVSPNFVFSLYELPDQAPIIIDELVTIDKE